MWRQLTSQCMQQYWLQQEQDYINGSASNATCGTFLEPNADAEEEVGVVEFALDGIELARRLGELELGVRDVLHVHVPLDVVRDLVAAAEVEAETRLGIEILRRIGAHHPEIGGDIRCREPHRQRAVLVEQLGIEVAR